MKIKYLILFTAGVCSFWMGCSKNPSQPEYQKEIMVFGYLQGNAPLDPSHAISIKYSQPLNAVYDNDHAAIRNAAVTLTNASTGSTWTLLDTDSLPGFYFNEELIIQPGTTYSLIIETEDETVTASTTVPPAISLTSDLRIDSVNDEIQKDLGYRKPIFVDCDECPDDLTILVDMFCDEPFDNAKYINPFFNQEKPMSQEEYDGGINGEPRHIQAMVAFQDLYSEEYGRHTIFWYASMIVYYGRQTMQVLAIDNNYKNYMFDEHPVYSGGIQGGLGVFASMCGQTYRLNIIDNDAN